MRTRRFLALLSAIAVALLLAGCVQASGTSGPSDPRSGAGLRYGLAPEPDQGTTFQPNVVLVQGGANAVRSVTADGLTWTLDPHAAGVSDLRLGRVMFLTDRGVGKVMAIHNSAKGLEVTVGPVTLTDVIKDGHYASTKPIPISQPVAIDGKGAFWNNGELQQSTGVSNQVTTDVPSALIRRVPTSDPGGPSRPPAADAIVSDIIKATTGVFDITGGCCSNGAGVTFSDKKNGLDLEGGVKLAMAKPTGRFHLSIDGGTVKEADLVVGGSLSVNATVHAVTRPGTPLRGWSPPLGTNIQFSVPIDRLFGVPLAMTVTQTLNVQVNIPGEAVFNGFGKINLGASVGFTYKDGKFTNGTSARLDTAASLDATNSIAVGISYASFWYEVRFNVGIGYLGFVAGVYLSIGVHITTAVGAPIYFNEAAGASNPIEACKSVQSELWTDYGVGYTIPKSVVKIVNAFLKVFNNDPIKATGGIGHGWDPVDAHYEVFPKSGLCQKQK